MCEKYKCFDCDKEYNYDDIRIACYECSTYTVRAIKPKLEIGDVVIYYPKAIDLEYFPCFGIVTQADDDIIVTIKWYGKFTPFSNWSKNALRNSPHIKICKEVSIGDLNL